MMKTIGLTGPSGAGKGALAARFAARGIPVIDADRVYRDLLVPPSLCLDALVQEFGPQILAKDGALDRAELAALVFAGDEPSVARRAVLNRITHRFVTEKTNEMLAEYRASGCTSVVIDAPLLIEADMHKICDVVIAVLADREVRLERLLSREGKSREALLARMDTQPSDDFYRSHADAIVINEGDEQHLDNEASAILTRLGLS